LHSRTYNYVEIIRYGPNNYKIYFYGAEKYSIIRLSVIFGDLVFNISQGARRLAVPRAAGIIWAIGEAAMDTVKPQRTD